MKLLKRLMKLAVVEKSGCWVWKGCCNQAGYGRVRVAGRLEVAHRVSYKLFVGEIPDGFYVCHRCDNPSCINPRHLWLGTALENMADMVQKGRGNKCKGEANGRSKLLPKDVYAIRASTLSSRKLAKRFGVCKSVIQNIKNRTRWKYLA